MTHLRSSALFDGPAVTAAVQVAATQSDALVLLGLKPHAANYRRMAAACVRFGLPLPGSGSARMRALMAVFDDTDAVRAALTDVSGYNEACERLGIQQDVVSLELLRGACDRHQLPFPGRRTSGTALAAALGSDARVLEALEDASSYAEVCHRLEVRASSQSRAAIREIADRHGQPVPTGRWAATAEATAASLVPREVRAGVVALSALELSVLLEDCPSLASMLARLRLTDTPGARVWLRAQLKRAGIAEPQGFSHSSIYTDAEIFRAGALRDTPTLRKRIAAGNLIPHEECWACGLEPVWEGQPLVLELDHISGDRSDNRLSNLRFLCPNCHSQTPTFRGRNIALRQQ